MIPAGPQMIPRVVSQGGPQMIPLKNLEWRGVSVKVKILEGENIDKNNQKQKNFSLISDILKALDRNGIKSKNNYV